jgi:predicted transcriptional regulator
MKKKSLTNTDINKIIDLYTSGEVSSTHSLAKIFKVGHKKISDILKKSSVSINKRGGQKKYYINVNENKPPQTLNTETEKIVAVCKETGKMFNDYSNKSGILINHLKSIINDLAIPSAYKRNMLFKSTGVYWHELFFDLKIVEKELKPTRKCRYCDWQTIDVGNKSGYYENHLKKCHNKTMAEYIKEYPEDLFYHMSHKKSVERSNYLSEEDNHVLCEICGEKFGTITNTHLKFKHGITMKKYNELYGTPKIVSNSISKILSVNTKKMNESITPTKSSKGEKEITDFIRGLGFEVISNDRSTLKGTEIDILIPELKIGIEYNGVLWHSENFGGKDLNYHLNKTMLMNFAGYKLLHIFSDEWNNKKEIVKSKLIHILGKSNSIKIGARRCEIKRIDFNLKCDFLNEFHIQGEDLSPINYGAFYGDILVGVMTFSNNRGMNNAKNDKNVFILNRFATNKDYVISGLGNKMVRNFMLEYKPLKIISFADRRWTLSSENNLYTKMGFRYVGNSKQSYFYFKRTNTNDRFHKFRMSKKKLIKKYNFNDTMTEWEMVKLLGYDRIWDCGLFKYELSLE